MQADQRRFSSTRSIRRRIWQNAGLNIERRRINALRFRPHKIMSQSIIAFVVATVGCLAYAGLSAHSQHKAAIRMQSQFREIERQHAANTSRISSMESVAKSLDERIVTQATQALASRLSTIDQGIVRSEARAIEMKTESDSLTNRTQKLSADVKLIEDLLSDHAAIIKAIRKTRKVDGLLIDESRTQVPGRSFSIPQQTVKK